jgi:cell division protein FtsN
MSNHGYKNNTMRKDRQQGGTLLGIIIGLIVGLAIAVVVALAITKTTLPFTNKNGAQPAAEPSAGQISDPNKPLYGSKEAARQAAKQFVKEPEAAAPVQIQPQAKAVNPAPKYEIQPDGKTDSKAESRAPVVEKSTAEKPKAADAVAKTDTGDDKFTYFLQAGAFREQTDAENARAKLALLGVEARITERSSDNGTLFRVRVGPFGQLETMNRMRSKLSENGVDVAVVRSPK